MTDPREQHRPMTRAEFVQAAARHMAKDEAEEFTQSLGQIVGGSWRQILWAEQQGIPKALGLSTRDWTQQRLGGYVRMTVEDRREAVKELAADGHTTREIADVVGAAVGTVHSDLHVQDRTEPEEPDGQNDDIEGDVVQDRTDPPNEPEPPDDPVLAEAHRSGKMPPLLSFNA